LSPIGKVVSTKTVEIFKSIKLPKKSKVSAIKNTTTSFQKENLPEPRQEEIRRPVTENKKADNFQKEFLGTDDRDDHLLKDEEIKYSPDLYVHYYQEKKDKKPKNNKNLFKSILSTIINTIKNLSSWFVSLYKNKDKRKYFYIIIAAILILIISLTVVFKGKGGSNLGNLESQKVLDEAIAAQKDAKNSLTLGDNEKAKQQFTVAISKAQSVTSSPLVAKDAEAVVTTSYQELDKLTSTTRFNNLEPIIAISDNTKGLFIASGEAFLVTENDIYKSSLLGGKPQKVASFPKNKGNFTAGTNLGSVLYFYTSNQNVFEFNPSSAKLDQTKIADDGRWETANAISSYVGSLYLLDGVLGQIYKHSSSQDTFEKGEEYTSTVKDLKESISMAVDGSIYILKNDGSVLKFQRSKLQDFSLKNVPTPFDKIKGPRKIYTDSDTPSLYVLDTEQKRILEFDKEGVFIRQYALPQKFEKITDFVVSVKSKKIWILNDNNVYEITI
ncbi:MAG: hypothetical protein WCV58_04250, partial [Patescibacteria group bacterium]